MSGLKELKSRIRTIDSTMKITSAMKMVSVSRLRKTHALLQDAYPYADEINRVFRRLVRSVLSMEKTGQKTPLPLLLKGRPNPKVHLLICVTSDEGLCGQFNETVLKKFEDVLSILRTENPEQKVNVLCFGYRGGEILKKKHPDLSIHIVSRTFDRKTSLFKEAQRLFLHLTDLFYAGRFDVCTVIYSAFISAIEQRTKVEQLVPLETFFHENKWDFLLSNDDPVYVKRDALGQRKIKAPALKPDLALSSGILTLYCLRIILMKILAGLQQTTTATAIATTRGFMPKGMLQLRASHHKKATTARMIK